MYERTSITVNGITRSKTSFNLGGAQPILFFMIGVVVVIIFKSCAASPLHKPSEEAPAASLPGVVGPERPRPPATFSNPSGVSEVKP